MATTIQDEMYKTFLQVQGQQATALAGVSSTLSDVLGQIQELRASTPAPNVKTTTSSSTTSPSQGSSVADTLTGVASTVFKSGFGLAPLVTGLFGLFGGGDAAPPPLVKYAMPSAVHFQTAESGGAIGGLDYNQAGMARTYRSEATISNTAGSSGTANSSPQITVNVSAMDARSFMDRSSDIALAVRDAMLNMNAINDVVNEL